MKRNRRVKRRLVGFEAKVMLDITRWKLTFSSITTWPILIWVGPLRLYCGLNYDESSLILAKRETVYGSEPSEKVNPL